MRAALVNAVLQLLERTLYALMFQHRNSNQVLLLQVGMRGDSDGTVSMLDVSSNRRLILLY